MRLDYAPLDINPVFPGLGDLLLLLLLLYYYYYYYYYLTKLFQQVRTV